MYNKQEYDRMRHYKTLAYIWVILVVLSTITLTCFILQVIISGVLFYLEVL